jgi:gas vesicle protein
MTASANQTSSELGKNVSALLNKAGENVGSTLKEIGQNMSGVGSELGSEILNETEQTAQKVGMGTADVLSNISGEIKEGISDK